MKIILILSFLILPFAAKSESSFEREISNSLTTSFLTNSIKWEDTRTEFILYAQSVFKKTQTVEEFLLNLESKPDKLDNKKIGPTKYTALNKLAGSSPKIMRSLQETIFDFALRSGDFQTYCRDGNITNLYWALYEYGTAFGGFYWIPGVTEKINASLHTLENTVLREQLIVLLLIRHLIERDEIIYDDTLDEIRNAIEITYCDSIGMPGKDSISINADNIIDIGTSEETEPCFFGGEIAMMRFIQTTLEYPGLSRENGEQGQVWVSFIIDSTGVVEDICIKKSPSELLSKEVIRVIQLMPPWFPGTQNGKAVRVRYSMPLMFRIA